MFKQDDNVTETQNKSATELLFTVFIIVTCFRSAISNTFGQLHRIHDLKECQDIDI